MKNKTEIAVLAAILALLLVAFIFAAAYLVKNFDIKMFEPKPEPGVSAFDSVESLPPKSAQKTKAENGNATAAYKL